MRARRSRVSSTAGAQHQSMPATSQLDWLISITAINVASISNGSRHRLRSFTVSVFRFVMTGLHRYCRQCSDGYVPSLPPHSILTAASTMARWQYRSGRRPCGSGARLVTTAILADSRFPFPQSLQKSGNSNREVHRLSRFRNHQTARSCLKLRALRSTFCAIQIELFPFMKPITSATEYFGGMEISMWT